MTSDWTAGDPLLLTGHIRCSDCGAIAWPADAGWFGDLILAEYAPGCGHLPRATWLVDPARLEHDDIRCLALRGDGQPCRAFQRHGSRFCAAHTPRAV